MKRFDFITKTACMPMTYCFFRLFITRNVNTEKFSCDECHAESLNNFKLQNISDHDFSLALEMKAAHHLPLRLILKIDRITSKFNKNPKPIEIITTIHSIKSSVVRNSPKMDCSVWLK